MDFEFSVRQKALIERVTAFMETHVLPAVPVYEAQHAEGDRWKVIPVLEELKAKARAAGLWNLFMPPSSGAASPTSSVRTTLGWTTRPP